LGIKAMLGDATGSHVSEIDTYATVDTEGEQKGFRIDGAFYSMEDVIAALFRTSSACCAHRQRIAE
jgi:hypothetical protein